jgi:pimeloyl-ACP methyl ester carboxylesterase
MAMDDLDAVRAALGYRQLDVIGSSYGATAAQVYLKLHPSSVRTLILMGGTAIDIPFFGRYAVNAQRALDQLARLCASDPGCRKAFPGWERQFGALVKAWNAHPANGMTGNELASIVHAMLLDLQKAVSIPLVISRAATGDYKPLEEAGLGGLDADLNLMGSSIWCNERWTGIDATGPWGTQFDTLALDAPQDQLGAGARLRGRRRPTGSCRQPLRPQAALPRQPHRDLPAHRAPVGHRRLLRPDRHGLRRPRHRKGTGHNTLLRGSRGATVPAHRLNARPGYVGPWAQSVVPVFANWHLSQLWAQMPPSRSWAIRPPSGTSSDGQRQGGGRDRPEPMPRQAVSPSLWLRNAGLGQ